MNPVKTGFAVGYLDEPDTLAQVFGALQSIHGRDYGFSVSHWRAATTLESAPGRCRYCFVVDATDAYITLRAGDRVRGAPIGEAFQPTEPEWAEVVAPVEEPLWPGDVVCVDGERAHPIEIHGAVTVFEVETVAHMPRQINEVAIDYPLPTAAFLRYLTDKPGGCAAYPGAFRREALPPVRTSQDAEDRRGVNRVNEHTLDMRSDRAPKPEAHHHGPVAIAAGQSVNHSETAIVLPRSVYGLPPMAGDGEECVVTFPDATGAPGESVRVVVRPGAVVVTPATVEGVAGHRFENAFAMLIAIPGFVSPHHTIG
jgi:hypothetical protein